MNSDINSYLLKQINLSKKPLTFADYMQAVLYHPQFGYYNQADFRIGKDGAFMTAPEISPLFAQCLAEQFHHITHQLKTCHVLEIGAGSGIFAGRILKALNALNPFSGHYFIYEPNVGLRNAQIHFIKNHFAEMFAQITWLTTLPKKFVGIIFANEVLDALPFHCFQIENNTCQEKSVTWHEGKFNWQLTPPATALAHEITAIKERYALREGYQSELCLAQRTFIQEVADCLDEGLVFLLDYGYNEQEYYHPERAQGTLACIHHGTRSNNPFLAPGKSDITAHVNFTQIANIANACGMEVAAFTDQANFLLANGLAHHAEIHMQQLSPIAAFELQQAIKVLTFPTEMGERVKVMVLSKHWNYAAKFKNRLWEL